MGTAAVGILLIQLSKVYIFAQTAFLTNKVLLIGALLIPFIFLGTVVGKKIMVRLSEKIFELIVEFVMLLSGLVFLIRG